MGTLCIHECFTCFILVYIFCAAASYYTHILTQGCYPHLLWHVMNITNRRLEFRELSSMGGVVCDELVALLNRLGLLFYRFRLRSPLEDFNPTFATDGDFQPNQPMTTFFANISPKPSITPFTNGSRRLTASAEKRAATRVRVERLESKMAGVTETDAGVGRGAGWEGASSFSGNVKDGYETFSHLCSSSGVRCVFGTGGGCETP